MLDQAGIVMAQGAPIACERIQGVNDNMAKSHYHPYFELYYLEAGERIHMIEDRVCVIRPGEFILFPPYVMHRSYGEQDVLFKRTVLYFTGGEIDSPALLATLSAQADIYAPSRKKSREIRLLLEALLAEEHTQNHFRSEFRHTLLNLLLLETVRSSKAEQSRLHQENQYRINEVIHFIHQNYQLSLSLEELAQRFYVSPYYLCREFKKYTNSTIVQYINVTRIMNAQRKFMETDHNVTEISRETGFSNPTHFNRVFKAVTGVSPSEYRRRYRLQKEGKDLVSF